MKLPDKLNAKEMSQEEWEHLRRSAGVRRYDILDRKIGSSDRRYIQTQNDKEKSGNARAYEDFMDKNPMNLQKGKLGDRFDYITEDVRANPDSLREDEAMYASSQPSEAQYLMGEAVGHLQGIQKQVYTLTMREGLSIAEAGKKIGISKSAAQGYRDRAIKFIAEHVKGVLRNAKD